jgi:hypothetical protein
MLPKSHTASANLDVVIWPGQANPRQLRITPHKVVSAGRARIRRRG